MQGPFEADRRRGLQTALAVAATATLPQLALVQAPASPTRPIEFNDPLPDIP